MEPKKVLILSQEPWSFLFLSKQNYAVAFAQKGYEVYFLSFPSNNIGWSFNITKDPTKGLVNIVNYALPLPHFMRFKAKRFYQFVNKLFIKYYFLRKQKNNPFLIAIDFGLYHYLYKDMLWANAKKNIFFPVDNSDLLPTNYKGANVILSVTNFILDRYKNNKTPKHFIHHGLATDYALIAQQKLNALQTNTLNEIKNKKTTLGYIGNLNIPFLDKQLLLQTINALPQCNFHFYGKLIRDVDDSFYDSIMQYKNVQFFGQLSPQELSTAMQNIDGFLMCYTKECNEVISGNSHKIMEYLSTGKVIFSTYLQLFYNKLGIQMTESNEREKFVQLVVNGVQNIEQCNSNDLQQQRIQFALQNTYPKNVEKIENLLGL